MKKQKTNWFVLNGKRVSITRTEDLVVLVIECYAGKEPVQIPVIIPTEIWNPQWDTNEFEFMEVRGSLTTEESAPHELVYQLKVDTIYASDLITSKLIRPQNMLECLAYLAQEPRVLNDIHPYTTTLYLGSGSIFENGVFSGERFKFDLTLLRKNTELAEGLGIGDVVKVKATITHSEDHGIQLVGKELALIEKSLPPQSPEKQIFLKSIRKIEENLAMNYSTKMELA